MNNKPKELKPCAHCGAVPQKYENDDYVVNHIPGCAIAAYKGSCNHWIGGTKAIKAWQTRATPDLSEIVEILHKLRDGDHVGTPINKNTAAMYLIEEALAKATKIGGVE